MPRDIFPILQYRDARAAIAWLERAFAFQADAVQETPDGDIGHAELRCGAGRMMLSSHREGGPFGDHTGRGWTYVVVTDPDAHHERAVAAGAQIVHPLTDQPYGSRDYSARDPEGNLWSFGTYAPD